MIDATLNLPDSRTLHFYDAGPQDADALPVFWLHGTPNLGPPPEPLFADAAKLGLRWLGYDRPGYGGSTSRPGRNVASSAADVAAIADHRGIDRFAVVGHSGGGPHALACAALLPERVLATISIAGLAPFDADGIDWFAGMRPAGAAGLRAACAGPDAKAAHQAQAAFDPAMFTDADWAALNGQWSWFHGVVEPAMANGPGGLIDDDIAYVTPWGFDPAAIARPVLLLHGAQDRIVPASHAEWLARQCPAAALSLRADDGHLSVLSAAPDALVWLRASASRNSIPRPSV